MRGRTKRIVQKMDSRKRATVSRKKRSRVRRTRMLTLDRMAKDLAMHRADGRCEKCGTNERLQCHHIITRRILSLRWEPDNLLILCAGCHLWWHHEPLSAVEWLQSVAPEERLDRLRQMRNRKAKPDLEATYAMLAGGHYDPRSHLAGTFVG